MFSKKIVKSAFISTPFLVILGTALVATVYLAVSSTSTKKGGGPGTATECSDKIDNDKDGYCDFLTKTGKPTRCTDNSIPGDPDCASSEDNNEATETPLNQAPVLSVIGNKSVNEGQLLTFTVSATDPENNPLTYSASGLPAGATFSTSTRNFSWTPTSTQSGVYSNIVFQASDGALTGSETITITVNDAALACNSVIPTFGKMKQGWPQVASAFPNAIFYPPRITDIDNDGTNEVVTVGIVPSSDGLTGTTYIYAWKTDGALMNGFPIAKSPAEATQSPIVADINGDGFKEIFVPTNHGIFAVNYQGQDLNGWNPIFGSENFRDGSIAAANMDSDSDLEIIAAGMHYPSTSTAYPTKLHVLNYNGSEVSGFPATFPETVFKNVMAVADVDKDSLNEIILAVQYYLPNSPTPFYNIDNSYLAVYESSGALKWRRVQIDKSNSNSVVVGDINNDGDQEIVYYINEYTYYSPDNLYILDGAGNTLKNFEFSSNEDEIDYRSFALGNINDTPELEIIGFDAHIASSPKVFAWDYNGNLLPNYPISGGSYHTIHQSILADIDNDGKDEIISTHGSIFTKNTAVVYAWNGDDASLVSGFPLSIPNGLGLGSAYTTGPLKAAVADMDKDGYLDYLTDINGGKMAIIELSARDPANSLGWPTLNHDERNSKTYLREQVQPVCVWQ